MDPSDTTLDYHLGDHSNPNSPFAQPREISGDDVVTRLHCLARRAVPGTENARNLARLSRALADALDAAAECSEPRDARDAWEQLVNVFHEVRS